MSNYYCKDACGTLGLANTKCTFICLQCDTQCSGKYATSLKDTIGKNTFSCKCNTSSNFFKVFEDTGTLSTHKTKRKPVDNFLTRDNPNKQICITL